MAVNPVDNNKPTTNNTMINTDGTFSRKYFEGKTANEILNMDPTLVPMDIIKWANDISASDPEATYSAQNAGGGEGGEGDNNQYEIQDMSLRAQCELLTPISAKKTGQDLNNIVNIAPFATAIPEGADTGEGEASNAQKVLQEINNEAQQRLFKGWFGGLNEDVLAARLVQQAIAIGTSEEIIEEIDDSIEAMAEAIDSSLKDAQVSLKYGQLTEEKGVELYDSMSWWQRIWHPGKVRAAKRAEEQGQITQEVSKNSSKLAEAVKEDNIDALSQLKKNKTDTSKAEDDAADITGGGEGGGGGAPSPEGGGAPTGGGGGGGGTPPAA